MIIQVKNWEPIKARIKDKRILDEIYHFNKINLEPKKILEKVFVILNMKH